MTTIEAMTSDLRADGTITSINHWTKGDHERTYITAAGYDASYKGCKTHQLYWDHKAGRLVDVHGPGTTPRAYDAACAKIKAAFAAKDDE